MAAQTAVLRNFIIILKLFVVFFSFSCAAEPVVETSHGKVSGKLMKTLLKDVEYQAFFGIPYAAPPVGDLRFLPPQPVERWDDIRPAVKETPACIQNNMNVKKGQPMGMFGSEDCLYLDVFTPDVNAKHPVIVFFHNTNMRNSYNKTKDYAPDFFIEEDVTIVTIAYRLAVFGFLSLEDEILPGNAGLRDVIVGLKWIQENIAAFGGDPDRVTLMGSQGGATLVELLQYTNSTGLFHSAILQGGTSFKNIYLQENTRERAFKLAKLLERTSGTSDNLLYNLRDISIEDLFRKEFMSMPDDYNKEEQRSLLPFGPIVEKVPDGLLTEYPEDKGRQMKIPIMMGFNSQEGFEASIQYLIEPRYLPFVEKDFHFLMPRRLRFKFHPANDEFYDAIDEIKLFYFESGKVNWKKPYEYVTYIGDVLTAYAVDYAAKVHATSGDLFYYYFDYFGGLNENRINLLKLSTVEDSQVGAASGDELCYLFRCPVLNKKYKKMNLSSSEDIIMQRKLVRLWANFAKNGNPTPDGDSLLGDLKWKPYSVDTKDYLHISKTIEMRQELLKERFGFWDKFIEKWESLSVNGKIVRLVDTNMSRDEL